jgi:hypothetical protein
MHYIPYGTLLNDDLTDYARCKLKEFWKSAYNIQENIKSEKQQ